MKITKKFEPIVAVLAQVVNGTQVANGAQVANRPQVVPDVSVVID